MNPSAPYPGRTLVQSNVIPVQNNTPNNLPSGWFYNGQLLRSDTQFATVVSAGVDFGTPSSLLRFTTGNFQWTTDRYIVGCFIDFTLQVTVATLFGSGGAYLIATEQTTFGIPSTALGSGIEGGATAVLIGGTVSVNHPGTGATAVNGSKTIGINFYPAPYMVRASNSVGIFAYGTRGTAAGTISMDVRATIFSIPAG